MVFKSVTQSLSSTQAHRSRVGRAGSPCPPNCFPRGPLLHYSILTPWETNIKVIKDEERVQMPGPGRSLWDNSAEILHFFHSGLRWGPEWLIFCLMCHLGKDFKNLCLADIFESAIKITGYI